MVDSPQEVESFKGEFANSNSKDISDVSPKKSAQTNGFASESDFVKENNEINKQSVITTEG